MKIFVKQSHLPDKLYAAILAAIIWIGIMTLSMLFWVRLVVSIVVVVSATVIIKRYDAIGMYYDGVLIRYKSFWREFEVDIANINSIKIVKAVQKSKHLGHIDLSDDSGRQLYSMIFLKEFDTMMENPNLNDMDFHSEFREKILFSTIYDQSVIDYLLTLNPNIIVF